MDSSFQQKVEQRQAYLPSDLRRIVLESFLGRDFEGLHSIEVNMPDRYGQVANQRMRAAPDRLAAVIDAIPWHLPNPSARRLSIRETSGTVTTFRIEEKPNGYSAYYRV